mmetsp:Transcript_2121/g.5738  ORF Transcript_2121/g.5738 Transcript_2121/m.5738 type:complete len:224 (+) Transcript_2121:760-1431(+)
MTDVLHGVKDNLMAQEHAADADRERDLEGSPEYELGRGLGLSCVVGCQPRGPIVLILQVLHHVLHGPLPGKCSWWWRILVRNGQLCAQAEPRQHLPDAVDSLLLRLGQDHGSLPLNQLNEECDNCVDHRNGRCDEESEQLLNEYGPKELREYEEPSIRVREDASDPCIHEEPPVRVLPVAVLRQVRLVVKKEVGIKLGKHSPSTAQRRTVAVPIKVLGRDAWT